MSRCRGRAALLAIAAMLASSQPASAQRGSCRAGAPTSRDLVTADGRTVYVEPTAFIADGGTVFLAGQPNYVFRGDSLLMRNGIFGVAWWSSRPARLVMSPLDQRRVGDVRLAALGRGRFAAVFAELGSDRPFLQNQRVIDLWFAVFDGLSWTKPQKLPVPPRGVIRSSAASSLIAGGGGLTIAYPLDSVSLDLPQTSSVGVFSWRGGLWSLAVIPTWMAGGVSLTYLGRLGLRLAVVQPDTSKQSDGGSVFLFGPEPRWENLGKAISGGDTYTDDPVMHGTDEYLTLSWHARLRNRPGFGVARTARVPLSASGSGPVMPADRFVTFDSSSIRLSALVRTGRQFWVSEHVLAEVGGTPQREFRIYADSSGSPVLIGRTPDDFDGTGFAAELVTRGRRLLIAGPFLHRKKVGGVLSTRILELPLECRHGAALDTTARNDSRGTHRHD